MTSPRVWLVLFVLPSLVVFGLFHVYLSAVYENTSFTEVVDRQRIAGSLYGTALNQNNFGYKIELARGSDAKVLAIGSSRVMQFREEFFTKRFVNMGGAVNQITEGHLLLDQIDSLVAPDLVLFAVDPWWFGEKQEMLAAFAYHGNTGNVIGLSKAKRTVQFLLNGRVSTDSFKYVLDNGHISNPFTSQDSLGFSAMLEARGFRPDGSRQYGLFLYHPGPHEDDNFQDTLSRIAHGRARFEHGLAIVPERKVLFAELVARLKSFSPNLAVILPPYAQPVYDAIQDSGNKYGYVRELRQWMQTLDVPVFDYLNPASLSANSCEFLDGFHGGDIAMQRLLLDMANKNSRFEPWLDRDQMTENLSRYAGQAFTPDPYSPVPELDFLRLGCAK